MAMPPPPPGPKQALAHVQRWGHAVSVMTTRVLNATDLKGAATKEADTQLLALAIRNHRRAVEWVESLLAGKRRQRLRDAIEVFDSAHPNLVHMRDVLEHFDEYTEGTGNLQVTKQEKKQGKRAFPAIVFDPAGRPFGHRMVRTVRVAAACASRMSLQASVDVLGDRRARLELLDQSLERIFLDHGIAIVVGHSRSPGASFRCASRARSSAMLAP